MKLAALLLCAGSACSGIRAARVVPVDAGGSDTLAFQADPPSVYVAKMKNILVGLPPTDDEVKSVVADPTALKSLIDGWMALPEYQQKMLTFFELAFQQTQISNADFVDMIPPNGIGFGVAVPGLVQNIRESFARTVLALVAAGKPLNEAFSTHDLMMTPPLMELYAFLDAYHVDDTGAVIDDLAKQNPTLKLTIEAAQGPIPIAQTIDKTGSNYMHWYDPDVATVTDPVAGCTVDPIVVPATGYLLHLLLYGEIRAHKGPSGQECGQHSGSAGSAQFTDDDFNSWKMVTLRQPTSGEATTEFYDLANLRAASELVLKTPRVGFFSTPAFGANWPTNTSNQMRVTLNQSLIVATGMAIDGTDSTIPSSTPGLDQAHVGPDNACLSCHQTLDPTRSILSSTYSWYYSSQSDPALISEKGLFAFQGVVTPVSTIDDFATTLANHPSFAAGWVEKLCYYANSAPCVTDDPEFTRIVGVFQDASFSWNAVVKELLASPLFTNVRVTQTAQANGEVIAVMRRDHLCAALNNRLGLVDVCGLDVATKKNTVSAIVSGLPSDGYGRGSPIPVLPNQPTLFYRAGIENICESVSSLVIDAAANPSMPNAVKWSSAQPSLAIADFVHLIMALPDSDARAAAAVELLTSHFNAAKKSGAGATSALRSTFTLACLSPSFVGIGM